MDEYKLRHEHPSDLDQMPISPGLGRGKAPRALSRISPAWIIGIVIVALLGLFAYLGASGGENDNTKSTPTTTAQSAAQKRAAAKKKAAAAVAARRARIRREKVKLQIQPQSAIFVCLENAKGKIVIPGQILQGGDEHAHVLVQALPHHPRPRRRLDAAAQRQGVPDPRRAPARSPT